MLDHSVSKAGKITAGVLGLLLLVTVLFSACFIAFEAEHDCADADCPICAVLVRCESILRQNDGAAAVHTAAMLLFRFCAGSALLTAGCLTACGSGGGEVGADGGKLKIVTALARKVDELDLHTVMTIEGTNHRIAETIIQNTQTKDQQVLTLDSMQAATAQDVKNGTTCLSVMENNLSVLRDALK